MRPTILRLEGFPSTVKLVAQPGGGFASATRSSGPLLGSDPRPDAAVRVTFELPQSGGLEFDGGGTVLASAAPPPRGGDALTLSWGLKGTVEPQVDFLLLQVYVAYDDTPYLRHGRPKALRIVTSRQVAQ